MNQNAIFRLQMLEKTKHNKFYETVKTTEIKYRYALQVYILDFLKRPAISNIIASRICKLNSCKLL